MAEIKFEKINAEKYHWQTRGRANTEVHRKLMEMEIGEASKVTFPTPSKPFVNSIKSWMKRRGFDLKVQPLDDEGKVFAFKKMKLEEKK